MTLLDDLTTGVDQVQDFLNNNNPLTQSSAGGNGFNVPPVFSADGNGLPYTKVNSNRDGQLKRNIITWFVPGFGVVRQFVNPERITYSHKKLINKDRTKGGFSLQWGEDLTTINLSGTTGSSGIEGINLLYEIYRAEQFGFDGVGLTLAANNAAADISNNIVNGIGGALGGAIFGGDSGAAAGAGILGGILGLDSPTNTLAAKNIPSLAQLAFTVEFFYQGWVHRGYFQSMTVNEKANDFMIDYSIEFVVTQRRGYRTNNFPWQHTANQGPSQYDTPHSFSGNIIPG